MTLMTTNDINHNITNPTILSNENDARLINVTNNDAKIAPVSLGHFHVNISSTKI
jgi:hypothetical protein